MLFKILYYRHYDIAKKKHFLSNVIFHVIKDIQYLDLILLGINCIQGSNWTQLSASMHPIWPFSAIHTYKYWTSNGIPIIIYLFVNNVFFWILSEYIKYIAQNKAGSHW